MYSLCLCGRSALQAHSSTGSTAKQSASSASELEELVSSSVEELVELALESMASSSEEAVAAGSSGGTIGSKVEGSTSGIKGLVFRTILDPGLPSILLLHIVQRTRRCP